MISGSRRGIPYKVAKKLKSALWDVSAIRTPAFNVDWPQDFVSLGDQSSGWHAGMIFFYCLSLLSLLLCNSVFATPDYHERLVLKPLPPSSLLASFDFRSNASLSSFEQQHFRFFPRSLGQILQHAKTRELHLRFSTGRWDAESWGARPWDGTKEGGTGVELWAWVEAKTDEE